MGNSITPEKRNLLRKQLEGCPAYLVEDHLDRLDSDYFHQFLVADIRAHLEALGALKTSPYCHVSLVAMGRESLALTVAACDTRGLFAILCGLLTLAGFNIQSGHIFTYRKREGAVVPGLDRDTQAFVERKKCIDFLELTHPDAAVHPEDFAAQLQYQLGHYLKQLIAKQYQEVRSQLHKRMGNFLSQKMNPRKTELLPVDIKARSDKQYTVLHIQGEESPAFLYSLANALALRGFSIHKVHIQTDKNRVNDVISITDSFDRPLDNPDTLDRLKVAVVLIKQFTLFLPLAPDSDQAMRQFDVFLDDLMSAKEPAWNIFSLEEKNLLALFAKLFGTGIFFCEQFMKMQYRTLLPLLKDLDPLREPKERDGYDRELEGLLRESTSTLDRIERINRYKDQELFRIDLSHLVYPGKSFIQFSEELNDLAEVILENVTRSCFEELTAEFGQPLTGGRPCRFALVALGKFGGREMGYASDIELVCIYEGMGFCEGGEQPLTNSEFFNLLIQRFNKYLQAKADGIFNVDLRLRPHGDAGPLASSFGRWVAYYESGGGALDYERQALIKLRPFYGDKAFAARILEERDRLIYGELEVGIENTLELRQQQLQTLVRPGERNAKYSKGGLVDIEYTVQILQLKFGRRYPELRVTHTVRALEILLELKCITPSDFETGYNGYAFLRRLINCLRMVRGNARDLVIPPADSDEFLFLARRMGYADKPNLSSQAQLEKDISDQFPGVEQFFNIHCNPQAANLPLKMGLPEVLTGSDLPEEERMAVVSAYPFRNPKTMLGILDELMILTEDRLSLLAVLVLMFRHLETSPDPDHVLLYFDKFARSAVKIPGIFRKMQYEPRFLEYLVLLFGHSDFLSNLLIQEPELIDFVTDPATFFQAKDTVQFQKETLSLVQAEGDVETRVERLRQYRNRELVRIGLRDIASGTPLVEIVRELSDLSDSLLAAVYHLIVETHTDPQFKTLQAVVALGKLGGAELNYSSDIDIVFVHRLGIAPEIKQQLTQLNNRLIRELTAVTSRGQLFRVDTTLRPYGTQGDLTASLEHYLRYYQKDAAGWEYPVWLKARPVCGNRELGQRVILKIQDLMLDPANLGKIHSSVVEIRRRLLNQLARENFQHRDVKSGLGGIRTIEFYVQGLQIQHGLSYPEIISGNTLDSLDRLAQARLISTERHRRLVKSYIFLRKIEHRLQMQGMQQRHLLPVDSEGLRALALRMGFEDRLAETALDQFQAHLRRILDEITELGNQWLSAKQKG